MTDDFHPHKPPPTKALPRGLLPSLRSIQPRWLSGPMLGLAAVLILFGLLLYGKGQLGTFLSQANLQVLLHTSSVPAVIALGMLVIILSGGIDLSVGSVVALVTVAAMQTYRALEARHGQALASLAAIGAGIGVGGLTGLINGLAITRLRVSPFVATLGMLSIARGLAVWLAARKTILSPARGRPGSMPWRGRHRAVTSSTLASGACSPWPC